MAWTEAARDADLRSYVAEVLESDAERAVRENIENRVRELWERQEGIRHLDWSRDSLALRVYGDRADAERLQSGGLVEGSENDVYGQVTRLPECLAGAQGLSELTIRKQKNFWRLPQGLGEAQNLRLLDVGHNPQLPHLPESVGQAPLTELHMAETGITGWPTDTSAWTTLQKLTVSDNTAHPDMKSVKQSFDS